MHDYPLRGHYNSTDRGMWTVGIQQAIDEAPTIDAVPVRCKDCKYAKPVIHRGDVLKEIHRCSYLKPNTDMFDIDYCRYGKAEGR